jgi:hypothetical protein
VEEAEVFGRVVEVAVIECPDDALLVCEGDLFEVGVYLSFIEFRVTALDGSENPIIGAGNSTLSIRGGVAATGGLRGNTSTLARGNGGTGSVKSTSGCNRILSLLILEVRDGICQWSIAFGSVALDAGTRVYRFCSPEGLETA